MLQVLDQALVRAGQGDQSAFEEVYDEVADVVYGLCLRLVGDAAGAEVAAREALVAVWRDAADFDPATGSARAWVVALAHGHAVRLRRGTAREARAPGRRVDRVGADHEQDLRTLDLVYFDGCTYRDVARRHDEDPDRVLARLRSALTLAGQGLSPARPAPST